MIILYDNTARILFLTIKYNEKDITEELALKKQQYWGQYCYEEDKSIFKIHVPYHKTISLPMYYVNELTFDEVDSFVINHFVGELPKYQNREDEFFFTTGGIEDKGGYSLSWGSELAGPEDSDDVLAWYDACTLDGAFDDLNDVDKDMWRYYLDKLIIENPYLIRDLLEANPELVTETRTHSE